MDFALFCTRVDILLLLLISLCSPCKFIQSPMDFGPLNFHQTTNTSSLDFGRIVFDSPSAVLRPRSPKEISLLLRSLSASSSFDKVTVAARGVGHSIHGQAQALDGIVIEMDSLPSAISIHRGGESGSSYADVSGGALWIELLRESLKFGLAPRSWTDYLYLSVGGTLSNGGISGQTFKHGPQISNVLQLDVVTGDGEQVTCSSTESSELFFAALGGLGQFGIITRARILLQDAPQRVKWVRAFYDDFETFTEDQELLVSKPDAVDYVEGFIVLDEHSLHSSSVAFPSHLRFTPEFHSKGSYRVYYCIEFAIHDYQVESTDVEQVETQLLRKMSHIPSHFYSVEVSYFDFLNRVRMEETMLRSRALWEVPHPWLNMFVPKSGIGEFKDLLLDNISPIVFEGLVLIYPLLREVGREQLGCAAGRRRQSGGAGDVHRRSAPVSQPGHLRSPVPARPPPPPPSRGAGRHGPPHRSEAVPGASPLPGPLAGSLRPALGPVCGPQGTVRPPQHPRPRPRHISPDICLFLMSLLQ
ncbi:cytokinin dehydrogenase 3-like isoform X1 [Musa acuminata AAA Group]|uniref:cytokinin dehydrogenase 3-like isoform X1 n=1 Tax=Musa acuminata AAA Group TaxID=214697 RepID=UPI0031DB4564